MHLIIFKSFFLFIFVNCRVGFLTKLMDKGSTSWEFQLGMTDHWTDAQMPTTKNIERVPGVTEPLTADKA